MTREEEIRQVSENYGNQKHSDGINALICAEDFKEGVNWADQHPRKGLWNAEKVIKWLRANIDNYANYNVKTDECFVNDFEEDLQKAMEE